MRNLAEHLKLLNTLFKDRRNNPLTTSYHFGRRIGKRGWFYALLRMLLVFFPVPLAIATIAIAPHRGTAGLYTVFSSIYLWFLPFLSFYLFGVHRIDRQTLEELSLTRLSRNELVFGIFFWPVTTVFLLSLTVIATGLLFIVMDVSITTDLGKWIPLSLIFWVSWIVCAIAKTIRNYNLHLKARLLSHLGSYVLLSMGFLLSFVFSTISDNKITFPVVLALGIGMLIITMGILEDVFTGAAHRAFTLARGKFPSLASSERSLLNQFYGLAAGVLAVGLFAEFTPVLLRVVYFLQNANPHMGKAAIGRFGDRYLFDLPISEFLNQAWSMTLIRATVGWDAFVFFMIVNVVVQALIGRWSAKKDPAVRIKPLTMRWEFWVFPIALYFLVAIPSMTAPLEESAFLIALIGLVFVIVFRIAGESVYLFLLNSQSPVKHAALIAITALLFHGCILGCALYIASDLIIYPVNSFGWQVLTLFTILCLAIITGFGPAMYTRLKLAHFGESIDDEVPIS